MTGTGEALRIARATHRVTMREVGEAIGMTGAAINYYEQINAVPDEVIAKLPKQVRGAVAVAALRAHEAAIKGLQKFVK